MYTAWVAMEHYRIHLIEKWPDGARKVASLTAAWSALASLEKSAPAGTPPFFCDICESRSAIELPMAA